eukprot:1162140-Pelagomonas_calceolata.AAC.6
MNGDSQAPALPGVAQGQKPGKRSNPRSVKSDARNSELGSRVAHNCECALLRGNGICAGWHASTHLDAREDAALIEVLLRFPQGSIALRQEDNTTCLPSGQRLLCVFVRQGETLTALHSCAGAHSANSSCTRTLPGYHNTHTEPPSMVSRIQPNRNTKENSMKLMRLVMKGGDTSPVGSDMVAAALRGKVFSSVRQRCAPQPNLLLHGMQVLVNRIECAAKKPVLDGVRLQCCWTPI